MNSKCILCWCLEFSILLASTSTFIKSVYLVKYIHDPFFTLRSDSGYEVSLRLSNNCVIGLFTDNGSIR